jgi:hypothetical protein
MSAHTPGPWHVERDGDETMVWSGRTEQQAQWAIADVCGTASGIVGLRLGEGIANARLIAAAPDLLAALKAIAAIQYNRLDAEQGELSQHVEIAKAAIAKAEGR